MSRTFDVWLIIGVLCGFPQSIHGHGCPQEPKLDGVPASDYWLEGTIGKRRVRMYLERGGGVVVGVFYDVADWVPLILRGRWADGDAIELAASTRDDDPIGKLKGRHSATGFVGTWMPEDGSPAQAVRLRPSSQDQCDGKGPWRRFSDPRWPITFSYPVSWRLETTDESISLTCPDPSLMVYLQYGLGVGQAAKAADNAGEYFVQCGKKWYADWCDCDDTSACREAQVDYREHMTILRDEQQLWRAHCAGGGYVGLTDGDSVSILLGQRWVTISGPVPPGELIQRILSTVKQRP